MREDLVTPATGRRLQHAGFQWAPQPGDWCIALGGEHYAEAQAGLWLVTSVAPASGELSVVDAAGEWPVARVAMRDCVWLPSSGKLKMWLRARGLRVATREAEAAGLGVGVRHLCRATPPGSAGGAQPVADGQGPSEAEAVAAAVLALLEAAHAHGQPAMGQPATPAASSPAWAPLPRSPGDTGW